MPASSPAATSTATSGSTPKPTPRPAKLTFGKLSYTAAGCWKSNYSDSEGHTISGTMVDFKVTAKNSGQVKSQLIPIRIETTGWFKTEPLLSEANWKGVAYSNDDKSMFVVGPAIQPGKSRAISWSVLFQSTFDVYYTVDVGDGHWEIWTSSEVCF